MLKSQEVTLKLSETRRELNAITAKDDPSDKEVERSAELRGELDKLEERLQAAIRLEDKPEETEETAEDRERLELRGKSRIGRYVESAMRGRTLDGPEAELQAAAGVEGIPFELWERPAEKRDERRDVTTAPAAGVGVNLQPIQPAIFAPSVAPMLMIDMPTVPSGSFSSATITTSVTAGALAKSGEAPQTSGALTASVKTPKRISGSLGITLEDIAAIGAENFEAALRENASLVLSDKLDDQLLNGAGSSNDLNGLIAALTAASDPTTGVEAWSDFLEKQASGVDGLWASALNEIALLLGVDSYRLAAAVFQGSDSEDSALSYMSRAGESVRTNKRMPAKDSHIQKGVLVRKGRPGMRTAVGATWGSVTIDDMYSGARKGERYITLATLVSDVIIVQPDAYAELRFRVST